MRDNNQKLLEGEVIEPEMDSSEADRLREELRRVSGERDALRTETIRLRQRVNQIDGPAAQLRHILEPLGNAIRAIMGEIEVIDPQIAAVSQPASANAPAAQTDKQAAAWDSWKKKLGGRAAEIITALQTHGAATTKQLAIIVGTRNQRISESILKLNRAGIIDKNGDKFSLKELP